MKLLRISSYFTFLLIITVFSCRKKEDIKQEVTTKPSHCYNAVMDGDETITDCGGSCGSCADTHPLRSSCYFNSDTIAVNNVDYSATSCIKTINGSGQPVYTISLSGGGTIKVTLNPAFLYGTLLSTASGTPAADECVVDVNAGGNSGQLTTGDVKIKTDGVSYAVDICAAGFWGGPGFINVIAFQVVD